MQTKQISQSKFNELTTSTNEQYLNLYANLPNMVNALSKFKAFDVNLIESSKDSPLKILDQQSMKKELSISIAANAFEDQQFFKNLPENLEKSNQYLILIDSIIANNIYYLLQYNKSKADYYIDNFLILALHFQNTILNKLINRIYSKADKKDIQDKATIVLSYTIYRFLLGNQHDMAKVKATDLLLNSDLLKHSQYESRVSISIAMNNLIKNANIKNTYDAFYEAGLFMEFATSKNFIRALSQTFDIRLIKTLFTNPKFANPKDTQGFYIYKIIILTISDILQVWNQYSKFKQSMANVLRVARNIIESMIKDTTVVLKKIVF